MLDDHRQVKVINGIPKVPEGARFKGSDGGQRHGDSAVAFCLAWNAAAFQALKTGRTRWWLAQGAQATLWMTGLVELAMNMIHII